MIKLTLKVILVMFLFLTASTSFAFDRMIDTSKTNPYICIYYDSLIDESIVQTCVDAANDQIKWISDTKDISLEQIPVPIFLYRTEREYDQSIIVETQGSEGLTLLWNPKILLYFNGSRRDLEHVLRHEITHFVMLDFITRNYSNCVKKFKNSIAYKEDEDAFCPNSCFMKSDSEVRKKYLAIFTGGNIPLWFMEGTAEAWSDPYYTQKHSLIRDIILWNKLPNIQELDEKPSYLNTYKLGESIVEFLEFQLGNCVVKEFISNTCGLMDSSFVSILGYDYEMLNRRWKSQMIKLYTNNSNCFQIYTNSTPATNVGLASWAPINDSIVYAWNESQVQITDGKKVYASDCNKENNEFSILALNACLVDSELYYSSLRDNEYLLNIKNIKSKNEESFVFKNIEYIINPVVQNDTIVFIGQNKNGYKSICIFDGKTFYKAINTTCNIQSVAKNDKFVFFIGNYENPTKYNVFVYIMDTQKIAKLTSDANARDLRINKDGTILYFIMDKKEYNYIGAYDLINQILYITYPIIEYIQFPYVGNKPILTTFVAGKYKNYITDPAIESYISSEAVWATQSSLSFSNHKVSKAKFKWNLTFSPVTVGYDTYYGFQGDGYFTLEREDGTKKYFFSLNEHGFGVLKSWNAPWKQKFIAIYEYNIYRFYTYRYVIKEKMTAVAIGESIKFSRYSELYVSLIGGKRQREYYMSWNAPYYCGSYFRYPTSFGRNQLYYPKLKYSFREDSEYKWFAKGVVTDIYMQYYYNDARYSHYWTPLSGTQLLITSSLDLDHSNKKIINCKNTFLVIKYISLGDPTTLAGRFIGGYVVGVFPMKYELGGLNTFRGYPFYSMFVDKFWLTNLEIRLPFSTITGIFNEVGSGIFLHHIKLKGFVDLGQIWIDGKSAYKFSTGFGLSGWFMYLPVQFYYAYNVERNKFRPFLGVAYDF